MLTCVYLSSAGKAFLASLHHQHAGSSLNTGGEGCHVNNMCAGAQEDHGGTDCHFGFGVSSDLHKGECIIAIGQWTFNSCARN
jgi:hypothetical protein